MWNAYQQLKVTVTAGVGQSPRKLPVDNLENFNERPDKRNEELEVCGQAQDGYFRVSKYSMLNNMRFKKVNLELAWLYKMSLTMTRPHKNIYVNTYDQ